MAWQSPSAMNAGGANGGGDGGAPAGTEYTLQGVMRFLQLEWHNHERARNAWDIERAEMKAKIAKQEGEVRSAKKLNDQLNKHIRMLEQALMNERKKKADAAGGDAQAASDDKDSKGKKSGLNVKKPQNKHHNSFLDVDTEFLDRSEADRDSLREKSKLYLTKCVEEITYLLTPPPQAPPQQQNLHALGNGTGFHGDSSMEDMYLQQHRQKLQSHLPTMPGTSMPNHQASSIPASSELHSLVNQHQIHHAPQMAREPSGQQPLSQQSNMTQDFLGQQPQSQAAQHYSTVPEEQIEKLTHTYDNHGRQIPNREEANPAATQPPSDETGDWTFDEPIAEMTQDGPPRRPDTEEFPSANNILAKSPPRGGKGLKRDAKRRLSSDLKSQEIAAQQTAKIDPQSFKVRFALRGHLDVVRSVVFTGGGSPSEPEICTAGDDGMIKRWMIPASYANQHSMNNDLDIAPYWSHRGHEGAVTSLAACPSSAHFSTGGRVSGDGWIFSGGQDATIRVWERGRVDPKATLDGHTDAVWTVCVLPATAASVFGADCSNYGGPDRILLASGSADGTIKIWAVSAPPQLVSPQTGSRRGVGGSRRHSVTSGSNHPSSPQPSVATSTPFHYMLIHTIERATHPSPTCISPLSPSGENFVVSFTDASILVYDTRTGEELIGMASNESYDGTPATGITSVVTSSQYLEGSSQETGRGGSDEEGIHGPTGSNSGGGLEGVIISGHEDHLIRKDGREAVSAGHDASIRFWSLDKRICTQEITAHRIMRGEGVCSVVWSQDGRLVVSAGGDGIVKVAALPQCVQSAKALYDLRSRYKDASVLITAIYSESMVIAASLSQVQNLLYHDALQSKPQLLETFDRALTGCRVVYGCLEEEVRELAAKAEADDLLFKDRAKFLWKEDTFKELLTQIRGQQSALSLLIQGLQMESIADIRKLVADNSVTLDQVVRRSRTLRQAHPRVKVPDSIFSHEIPTKDSADAESIIKSAEFAFDDEVINSKAYRKAMAFYMSHNEAKTSNIQEKELEGSLSDWEPTNQCAENEKDSDIFKSPALTVHETKFEGFKEEHALSSEFEVTGEHQDLFDSLERDILAFMPRIASTSTAPDFSTSQPGDQGAPNLQKAGPLTPKPLRSFSEGNQAKIKEELPPLPPRRPSEQQLRSASATVPPEVRSSPSDDSICTSEAPSVLSKVSTASSNTLFEPSQSSSSLLRRPLRKSLPLTHQVSRDYLGGIRSTSPEGVSFNASSPLKHAGMREIWNSLLDAEHKFVERMMKFRKMFYNNVIVQWPILERHLEAILIGEQLATLNKDFLLDAMVRQLSDDQDVLCDPSIFEAWTNKTHKLYREFCQHMPHAMSSLRTTQSMDPKFTPFVHTLGLSLAYFGRDWHDYLTLPNVQLQSYVDNLRSLVSMAESLEGLTASNERARLKRALEAVTWLRTLTSTILDEAQHREDIQNLEKRLHTLDANLLADLRLLDSTRRLRAQGSMAMKLKSQGPWQSFHVVLLDNYLFWGKVKPQKKSKGDKVLILDAPISITDLQVQLPCGEHQYQKATMFDEIPRGSVLYLITVKDKNSEAKPHMLGLNGFQERKDWWDHFTKITDTNKSAV
ncbi:1,2-dihydroxy-3-keto-5-methylthiopentene dioxygenase [Neocucurbitaria cava]|uniref:1,2-dihydroxy-3-keto-5-methylthiopentene dioxygenase n=1 Tax=Neocucurbitaria cava TaxID=798079 RepID=A0A9W9CKC4_9PLEO|nr:1,2-dihydroxy-3-keto-5-methylthiopentene dioxygenase [Neocucurbitaria cava]